VTEQLELREWYRMRIDLAETGGSIFDLQSVSIYLLKRYANQGRAQFCAGMAIETRLTKKERKLFLGWLRRNGLLHLLDNKQSYDDGQRGKGKGRRRERYAKEGHQPGRKSLPAVAKPDTGTESLFHPDDEGI
jgi:hypothetical protein